MTEIWIVEEKISNEFLEELNHPIKLHGNLDTAYFINADGEDYVERNKNFLLEFLLHQNKYPLIVTFVVYDDQTDEYVTFLKGNNIDFTLNSLEEKRAYYNYSGKHQYHPPCFTARINNSNSLTLLLNEIYWLPAQNEFFSISFSDNSTFELMEVAEWFKKRKRSVATFEIVPETTFITTVHDGAGFYLFSNEEKYFPVGKLIANFPKGTVITQINDTLITGDNISEE